jgi:hypothetical protein
MKIERTFSGVVALALALSMLLIPGAPVCAATLQFSQLEIRDPLLNNAVAARVTVPQGWIVKEQRVPWNNNTYADPAHVVYALRGPAADEVEFASISRIQFNFNQGMLAMFDEMHNMLTRQTTQLCQMGTGPYARQMCAQMNAKTQQELNKLRQQKQAYVSGQTVDGGMVSMQPMWAADFARWLLRQNREITDVRVKKVEKPHDLTALLNKAVAEEDAQVRQMAAQFNMPLKGLSFDVARLEFSYTSGGKRYDGITLVVTRYLTLINNQRMPSISGGADPFYGKEFVVWSALMNGASALEGRLKAHEAALTVIAANSAVDPLWQATVDRLAAETSRKINEANSQAQKEMLAAEMKHQQKMQQMRNETFAYVNQRQREVFAQHSASLSKASAAWTDAITDRQVWEGSSRKFDLPNDYKYAWESDGKVVTSNNPNFNPNHSSDYSGNWSEMRMGSRFD